MLHFVRLHFEIPNIRLAQGNEVTEVQNKIVRKFSHLIVANHFTLSFQLHRFQVSLVAWSEITMSYVASEVFAATVGGMENRLAVMETRLIELFTKTDEKLVQQADQIQETQVKIATLDGKLTQMPEQLKVIIDEHRAHAAEKSRATDEALQKASDVVMDMKTGIQAMRTDLNSVQSQVDAGGGSASGGGNGGGKRSLIDPKTFKLLTFDGDKHETKQMWEDWREDMEDYLQEFHKGIKPILEKAARWKVEITGCIPICCCRCRHGPEYSHLELQRGREGTHYLCQEILDGPSSESFQQQ